jgi:hypothetical protein
MASLFDYVKSRTKKQVAESNKRRDDEAREAAKKDPQHLEKNVKAGAAPFSAVMEMMKPRKKDKKK